MSRHVVIVTEDRVGEAMGGAAIRAFEMARGLAEHVDVTLAAPGDTPPNLDPARHVGFDPAQPRTLRAALKGAGAVVTRPQSPLVERWLRSSGARIVYDLIDPLVLDILEARAPAPRLQREFWNAVALDHFLEALHGGHHFICAGERQRDLYLGAMLASRLISPAAYRRDPSLRSVIDKVPFGVPEQPPERVPNAGPRARFPALGDDAEIVLWNGGIWNWLDPETAVRAVALAAERRPNARLVFMIPRLPEGPEGRAGRAALDLARTMGILDRLVFFNDGLVPYAERASWLLDADAVITTHVDHLEARFAFRTRLLDAFWAGVPAVCTEGDELSELIERRDLGASIPPEDAAQAAAAIERVLARGRASYTDGLARTAAELTWPRVLEPLVRFVIAPALPPRLGEPWARRLANPVHRFRATSTRLARSLSGG